MKAEKSEEEINVESVKDAEKVESIDKADSVKAEPTIVEKN